MSEDGLLIGAAPEGLQRLTLRYANRHGLIAGATGTGKTVTLQILAEAFSDAGAPVFLADVKGDLSGLCCEADPNPKLAERAASCGVDGYAPAQAPTVFWDMYGEQGHPVRATIAEMGPLLLSNLLDLTDAQEGAVYAAFALADDEGLALLDLDDLRTTLNFLVENRKELASEYGRISSQSVGAIQRKLLGLERDGGEVFFGEPALKLDDLMRTTRDGRGYINVLAADKLIRTPRMYATFLLWLLSELFEELPEVGDPDVPKLVFFFDEAHLLFDNAPKALLEKVEQVVRLIRSKGVGVYFVTQSPTDLPDDVLGQLGCKVQHALRAFTAKDRKAIRAASENFRADDDLDVVAALTDMGVGEALVSTLEAKGVPSIVRRTKIRPPASRMGPATPSERAKAMRDSPAAGIYDEAVDPQSAHEILTQRAQAAAEAAEKAAAADAAAAEARKMERSKGRKRSSNRQGVGEALLKSVVRNVGGQVGRTIGREIVRGLLGGLLRR